MRRAGTVRLTRRGRAVLLGLCLLLVGLCLPPAGLAASAAGGAGDDTEVAIVRPGDTLWSVAARHAPSRDPYGIIKEIRRLNDLPDHTIHPGQELVLPP